MKICKLMFRGFRQFGNTDLDFTDPDGEPVDRVCLIGPNGTGKSTVLTVLRDTILSLTQRQGVHPWVSAVKLKLGGRSIWVVRHRLAVFFLKDSVEAEPGWIDEFKQPLDQVNESLFSPQVSRHLLRGDEWREVEVELQFSSGLSNLFIYSPPETQTNEAMAVSDVPKTNVNEALKLRGGLPVYHEISTATVVQAWRILIYLLKKRQSEREEFETRPENINRSKRELIEDFDRLHPDPLRALAPLWDRILGQAGLELDLEHAKLPIQLTDNLDAYVRLKSTGERIGYNLLSTGIRNFIFRIGHIFLLYFGRKIERGFLLVDEPENSLFPDFLFDLMDIYGKVVRDSDDRTTTQTFVATHSPIVAAQFEPHERIILNWDDGHRVVAKKGVAPIGDDPNDLLRKDFGLSRLMGDKGQEKWSEYLDLRKRIRRSTDDEQKRHLVERAAEIGGRYGFETPDDIPAR
jgi:hypothetical protein